MSSLKIKYISEFLYVSYWLLVAYGTKLVLSINFGLIEYYILLPGRGMFMYDPSKLLL